MHLHWIVLSSSRCIKILVRVHWISLISHATSVKHTLLLIKQLIVLQLGSTSDTTNKKWKNGGKRREKKRKKSKKEVNMRFLYLWLCCGQGELSIWAQAISTIKLEFKLWKKVRFILLKYCKLFNGLFIFQVYLGIYHKLPRLSSFGMESVHRILWNSKRK